MTIESIRIRIGDHVIDATIEQLHELRRDIDSVLPADAVAPGVVPMPNRPVVPMMPNRPVVPMMPSPLPPGLAGPAVEVGEFWSAGL